MLAAGSTPADVRAKIAEMKAAPAAAEGKFSVV